MKILVCSILLFLSLAACDRAQRQSAPRPRAFPRVELYADSFTAVAAGRVGFIVPAQCTVERTAENWVNIGYSRFGATMYVAVRGFDSDSALENAIENRAQRMTLNLGTAKERSEEFDNRDGFRCIMLLSADPSPLPVQFVAIGPQRTLVSGAVALSGSIQPVDSLAPVIGQLEEHSRRLLESLTILR